MMPTLGPGSIVVIDLQAKEIIRRHIYAVRLPDEACAVKRLILDKTGGGVILISDNRHYPPRIAPNIENLVIGRVVWACQSFDYIGKVSACDV